MINLYDMNTSLLCKWLWDMVSSKSFLWKDWILATQYDNVFSLYVDGRRCSRLWKDIMSFPQLFKIGLKLVVNDGCRISFWHDRWLILISLAVEFDALYELAVDKYSFVAKMYDWNAYGFRWKLSFNRIIEGRALFQLMNLIQLLNGYCLKNDRDKFIWQSDNEEYKLVICIGLLISRAENLLV